HQLGQARTKLQGQAASNAECEALLIDLALTQLKLADDDKKALEEHRRVPWRKALQEVARTLNAIPNKGEKQTPDARNEGVRLVTRRLLELKQDGLLDDLVRQVSDGPQVLAVVGLELLRHGNRDAAGKQLTQALAF